MNKNVKYLILFICVLVGINKENVFAKEMETTIRINELSVEVPYSQEEIEVEREENLNETKVIIKDKKTGSVIRTVGETGWTKMAPNKFEVYGTTNIVAKTNSESTSSLSFEVFEGLGFEMSGSSSSTWHARKLVNGGFVYKI